MIRLAVSSFIMWRKRKHQEKSGASVSLKRPLRETSLKEIE
jgi:uncharacterized iron-regulated membrane protein